MNQIGAMLLVDGDFRSGTEQGVRYAQDVANQPETGSADEALWSWMDIRPEPPLATNDGD